MQCPVCADSRRVEINLKSDGYTPYMFECGSCGALWVLAGTATLAVTEQCKKMEEIPL